MITVVGVHGCQAQVAGLCVGDGCLHGFLVTDFANQDTVRGLAHGVAERLRPSLRVHAKLALVDDGFFMLEKKFDRVFDRQDMSGAVGVAVIQYRGNRR